MRMSITISFCYFIFLSPSYDALILTSRNSPLFITNALNSVAKSSRQNDELNVSTIIGHFSKLIR